jgi:cytochrome b6-f complex iron-sulfur subunit
MRILLSKKNNSSMKIYSSKCSHLGCKIKSTEGNEFVCPCHGSRYDFNGKVLKGPAQNPLTLLRFKKENNRIIIYES